MNKNKVKGTLLIAVGPVAIAVAVWRVHGPKAVLEFIVFIACVAALTSVVFKGISMWIDEKVKDEKLKKP